MTNDTTVKKRDIAFDFFKGAGIFLVLFIHSLGGWDYETWSYYVPVDSLIFNSWFWVRVMTEAAVPIFFFATGYFIPPRAAASSDYYWKRAKRIVVPFFVWSAVYTLVNLIIYQQDVTFVSFLLGTNGIQLYFLFVLIQFMLITPFLQAVSNRKLMLAACLAITLANDIYQLMYWLRFKSILPNEMILGTCFIAYYYLGYYFKTSVDIARLNTKKIRIASLAMVIIAYGLLLKSSYWLLALTNDPTVAESFNNPANLLYSLAAIICIMAFKDLCQSGSLIRKIAWVGVNSMDFFAVHWLLMYPMKLWLLRNILCQYMWLGNIGLIIATFICSMLFVLLKQKWAGKVM